MTRCWSSATEFGRPPTIIARRGARSRCIRHGHRQGRLTREGRFLSGARTIITAPKITRPELSATISSSTRRQALTAARPRTGRFAWPRIRRAERDGEADAGQALDGSDPTSTRRRAGSISGTGSYLVGLPAARLPWDCREPPPSSARRCASSTSRRHRRLPVDRRARRAALEHRLCQLNAGM